MNFKKTSFAAIAGLALAASAFAASHSPITERQEAMKAIGGQMRTLGGMARGSVDYDDLTAISALEIMRDAAIAAQSRFPAGSDMGAETRAMAAIWAADSDFDARMAEMVAHLNAAVDAEPADAASFGPLFGAVAGTCKGCHENYRAPEE